MKTLKTFREYVNTDDVLEESNTYTDDMYNNNKDRIGKSLLVDGKEQKNTVVLGDWKYAEKAKSFVVIKDFSGHGKPKITSLSNNDIKYINQL